MEDYGTHVPSRVHTVKKNVFRVRLRIATLQFDRALSMSGFRAHRVIVICSRTIYHARCRRKWVFSIFDVASIQPRESPAKKSGENRHAVRTQYAVVRY